MRLDEHGDTVALLKQSKPKRSIGSFEKRVRESEDERYLLVIWELVGYVLILKSRLTMQFIFK